MKIVNPFNKKYLKAKKLKKLARSQAEKKLPIISTHLQENALNSTISGIGNKKDHSIAISLTTFGDRINDIHLTIESLMQQSLKADHIVLNLSNKEFSLSALPAVLHKQCARGLNLNFIKEDLGPYTKFFYTLQTFPNSLIVTVDDDQIYPIDLIDQLYRAYLAEPDIIHCHRAHKISFDRNRNILPYRKWDWSTTDTRPSKMIFPTGVGGVIYFPGCFDNNILDKESFLKICPGADDVWLKAMSLKNGILCKKITDSRPFSSRFLTIEHSQTNSLIQSNKKNNSGNDKKIQSVFSKYNLFDELN